MSKSLIDLNSEEIYKIIKTKINNQIKEEEKQKKLSPLEYIYTQE